LNAQIDILKETLLQKIDNNSERIIEVCSDLIKIPSENPPGDTSEAALYAKEILESAGIPVELYEPEPNRVNVVATLKGAQRKPGLVFNAHFDVVPAGDPTRWKLHPYSGIVKEGKIFGRGASDMKGALAAMMLSVMLLVELDVPLRGDVTLTLVDDEETGGKLGTGWLVEHKKVQGDACVNGDTGGFKDLPYPLCLGDKGGVWVKIVAKGIPTHASRPFLGENAITKLIEVLPSVQTISQREQETPPELKDVINQSAEYFSKLCETRNINPAEGVKLFKNYTCSVGVIKGGVKTNVVPGEAEAELDIRINPGVDANKVIRLIQDIIAKTNVDGIEVQPLKSSIASFTSSKERIARIVKQNMTNVFAYSPPEIIGSGGTDSHYFRASGIPTVTFGCLNESSHGIDEYVSIPDLVKTTKVYALSTLDFVGLE